jgi:peptidoglycan/xylan/chitin deacetylase (PgdA/CDA1 family)
VRRRIKRILEGTLARSPLAAAGRRRRRHRALILAYHNVVPDQESREGDTSLHLTQSQFAAQLDFLLEHYDVVTLDEAISGRSPKRSPVVVTFDDAYRGAMTVGLHELERRSLPATVFVSPGLLGQSTWWDVLSGPDGSGLSDDTRSLVLDRHAGLHPPAADLPATPHAGWEPGHNKRIIDEDGMTLAAQYAKLTVASHAWSHPNLAQLHNTVLVEQLEKPIAWLAERFQGRFRPWLAYPYGLFSEETRNAAQRVGYEFAFAVTGGPTPIPPVDLHAIPRFNIPAGISLPGFALRLSGVSRLLGYPN